MRWLMPLRGLAVLLLVSLSGPVANSAAPLVVGTATSPAPAPEAPPPEDIRELTRLLGDPRLMTWLERQAAGDGVDRATGGPGFQAEVGMALAVVRGRFGDLTAAWAALPEVEATLAAAWAAQMTTDEALRSIIYLIVFLFVGAGLEWLYWRYAGGALRRIELARPTTLGRSLVRAFTRAGLLVGGILLFALGSVGTFLGFDWAPLISRLVLSLLLAVVTLRLLATVGVLLLAPRVDDLRLVPLSRGDARRWFRWTMAIGIIGVVGSLAAGTLSGLGVPDAAVLAIKVVVAVALTLALIVAVWRLTARPTGGDGRTDLVAEPRLQPRNFVPVLSSALVLVIFGLWLLGAGPVLWTVVILALAIAAVASARALVDHGFDRAEADRVPVLAAGTVVVDDGDGETVPGVGPYDVHRPIVQRLVRFALVILTVLGLGWAWGVNVLSLSTAPTLSGRAFGIAVDITVALLIADMVWVWGKTAIDRRLANFEPPEPGHAPGPEARMATLLPLFRKVLMVTVIVMVVLIALSSLGINIGPLIAGAGVVGIAIGFGAQTLVRDIVSGVFFLIDDAFRVGEYIEMGELRGTVESISVRSLRVRHHRGAVHTIPFGELKSLTNYSRDWVVMKLEFRVPFDTDVNLVKRIVKDIGKELQANPEYGQHILEPLKSQGVRRMEEFNMVIGVKFMAKPGEQWTIRRDAYQRIRDAFEAHGIDFAARNVKVEVVSDPAPSEAVRQAAIGAAQDAIEAAAPKAAGAAAP